MPYPWDTEPYSSMFKQYPSRPIRGTDIFEKQGDELILIGHTLPWCNDLESTLNEALATAEQHYARLVELGDITPKATTEELLSKAMAAIEHLSNKIDRMENGVVKHEPDRQSDGNVGDSKPANGKKSKE